VASVRGVLRSPACTGRALTDRTRMIPARPRKSAPGTIGRFYIILLMKIIDEIA